MTPELAGNESLLLEVPDIMVKNIDFSLFLTNRRLILSENMPGNGASSEIPIPVILSAVPGTADTGEPSLVLTIKAPDGSDRKMVLVFMQSQYSGDRSPERDRLIREIDRGESPRQGISHGISSRPAGRSPVREHPPDNILRPPPPPIVRDSGMPYRDPGPVRRGGDAFQAPPPPPPPPPSYDPDPFGRVAPQYARPANRSGSSPYGGHGGSNYSYSPPSGRRQRSAPGRKGSGARNSGGGYVDTDSVYGTILGILRSPEEVFRQTRRKEPGEVLPVLLVSLAIFAFGNAFFLGLVASSIDPSAYPALSGLSDMGTLIFVVIEVIILGVIFVAVTGLLLHFGAYYEGFDDDIHDSVRVAAYSAVPFAVGGVIPVFGLIIAPVWSVYLLYKGMRETFYMDSDQAIVAALVPVAAFVILFIIMVILGEDNFSIFGTV